MSREFSFGQKRTIFRNILLKRTNFITSFQWTLLHAQFLHEFYSLENPHDVNNLANDLHTPFDNPATRFVKLQKTIITHIKVLKKREREREIGWPIYTSMHQHAWQLCSAKDHRQKETVSSYPLEPIFHINAFERPRQAFVVLSFLRNVLPKVKKKKKDRRPTDRRMIEKA